MNLNYESRKSSSDYVPLNPKNYNSLKVPKNSLILGHIGGIDQKPSEDYRLSLGCGCYCRCSELSQESTGIGNSIVCSIGNAWVFHGNCGIEEPV